MSRRENDLTCTMITEQLDPKYFDGWTNKELDAVEAGNKEGIAEALYDRLVRGHMIVREIHIIIHDRCKKSVWSEHDHKYVVCLKPKHFHAVIKFVKGGTIMQVANAVGIAPANVEKPHTRGRYAYDDMLAYLIHIKYAKKTQYKPDEVYTLFGVDTDGTPLGTAYAEYYADRKADWELGRVKMTVKDSKIDIDILESKILEGEVTRSQVLLTDDYFAIYAHNKRRCDDAFDTFADRKIAKTMQAMENGEFRLSVFFITGKSHSGKSMFTDYLVKNLQDKVKEEQGEDWQVCSCASSNPFDEYRGEEILVMDDLRGMALTASDWLKLLDPDRINTGSARYHNKKMACRTIFINSEKDVTEFFYYVKGNAGNRSEAMDQFIRRIMARVVVVKDPYTDERFISIGQMHETTEPMLIDNPAKKPDQPYSSEPSHLKVNHWFSQNSEEQNMEYEAALNKVTDMVMQNNFLNKESEVIVDG